MPAFSHPEKCEAFDLKRWLWTNAALCSLWLSNAQIPLHLPKWKVCVREESGEFQNKSQKPARPLPSHCWPFLFAQSQISVVCGRRSHSFVVLHNVVPCPEISSLFFFLRKQPSGSFTGFTGRRRDCRWNTSLNEADHTKGREVRVSVAKKKKKKS